MKHTGIPLSSFPPAMQAQIDAQLHSRQPGAPVQKPRLRQSAAGLNQTEAAFKAFLAGLYSEPNVYAQDITLRLANGVRYTPDFVVYTPTGVLAYEVKGFMRDDAAVKLKVAAQRYPWIRFLLATKRKKSAGGAWQIDFVLP